MVIPGDFHSREDLFDLDPIIKDKPDHFLCITGVPDNTPSLDFYKYQGAVYTRYVEGENNKGFLLLLLFALFHLLGALSGSGLSKPISSKALF